MPGITMSGQLVGGPGNHKTPGSTGQPRVKTHAEPPGMPYNPRPRHPKGWVSHLAIHPVLGGTRRYQLRLATPATGACALLGELVIATVWAATVLTGLAARGIDALSSAYHWITQ